MVQNLESRESFSQRASEREIGKKMWRRKKKKKKRKRERGEEKIRIETSECATWESN